MAEIVVSILKRATLRTAPEGIWFQASVLGGDMAESLTSGTYDESFHRYLYVWDFDDAGAVTRNVTNLPRVHADLNRAYGKHVAHVFRHLGSYTVTCTVHTIDGPIGRGSITVTVAAPETIFPGEHTIVVDPQDVGASAYPDATRTTSWQDAVDALVGLEEPGRILLPRGGVFEVADAGFGDEVAHVYIGVWGQGEQSPVLRTNSSTARCFNIGSRFSGDFTLAGGISIIGDWDSTTETGSHGAAAAAVRLLAQRNTAHVVLDNIHVSGFGQSLSLLGAFGDAEPTAVSFLLHDSVVTNWGDYGVYAGRNRAGFFGLIGSTIAQDVEAMQGGAGKDFTTNQHGPVRIIQQGHVFIDACDLFSRTGWTQPGRHGLPGQQPCLRLGTGPEDGSMRAVVTRNAMEGGFPVLSAERHLDTLTPHPMNALIEKNYLVGSVYSERIMLTEYAGFTIRNNIGVKPNLDFLFGRWRGGIVCRAPQDHPDWSEPENGGFKVEVYNNTIACLLDDRNRDGHPLTLTEEIDGWAVFSDENNLLHAPNATGQEDGVLMLSNRPIETVGGVWRPRFLGLKYNAAPGLRGAEAQMRTEWATPAGIADDFRPKPNSPVAGTASGRIAVDDFYGVLRESDPGRGAVE